MTDQPLPSQIHSIPGHGSFLPSGQPFVPGYGPLDAKIVIIGEAPGEHEERAGMPFVGPSGKLLNHVLEQAGISRSEVYCTNVVKFRPPLNNFDLLYDDNKRRQSPSIVLKTSIAELHTELRRLKPNVIVCCGGEALRAITNYRGIDKYRGSILSTPFGKCIPTFHPAYVLRFYEARPIMDLDFARIKLESTNPFVPAVHYNFETNPSFDRVREYLHGRLRSCRVAFDIETYGPFVRCLGLSHERNQAFCIPFMSYKLAPTLTPGTLILPEAAMAEHGKISSHWTVEQEHEIIRLLHQMFSDPRVQLVAQNFPFDSVILKRNFGITFANVYMDTMLAHHTCYCELPKGLDFLCSMYTRIPYYSDYDAASDESTWRYNCFDCCGTYEISEVLDKELIELKVDSYYRYVKHPAMLAYVNAETKGVKIDLDRLNEIRHQTESRLYNVKTRISELTNHQLINPSSDHQVKDYVYNKLKLPVIYHFKTKQPTTDKTAREKLRLKHPEHTELFEHLDEYSKLDTLLTGFINRPLVRGRARTHYNAAGTDTDRLSSSAPMYEPGTNLANIPKGSFRGIFIADDGWVLSKWDLSQAEWRIVVYLARINRVIQRYKDDPEFDIHTDVAARCFNVRPEHVELKRSDGKPSQRDLAKNGVYGGNYHMSYITAARTWKVPLNIARMVLDNHVRTFPEIPRWWQWTEDTLRQTRRLTNPMGRTRIYFGRLDDDTFRTAYSDQAQSTVAGVINRAFAIANQIMNHDEAFPLLQVHDEIVFAIRKDSAILNKTLLQIVNLMEYPLWFPGITEPLIIPADGGIGPDWNDQTKLKDHTPEGIAKFVEGYLVSCTESQTSKSDQTVSLPVQQSPSLPPPPETQQPT